MLDVKGFCGLTFNLDVAGALDNVVTPPYDVISEAERDRLAARSPHNFVHVLLPKAEEGKSRYEVAGERFEQWIQEGALEQDAEPSLYLLRQTFADLDGFEQVRRGFFAVTRLPDDGDRSILGHERTFDRPVEDRLKLMEATQANFGAVFALYADPDAALGEFLAQMDQRPADVVARTIDGVRQEFWRVPYDPRVTEFMRDKTLYIADGHHRFQTARTYRDRMRAQKPDAGPQPYDYALMGFVAFEDPGLKIYPPHRVLEAPEGFDGKPFLEQLGKWFEVTALEPGESLPERVENAPEGCVIGLAMQGTGDYLLTLRDIDRAEFLGDDRAPAWRELDVAVLHRGIIERILGLPSNAQFTYEKNARAAVEAVRDERAGLAFLLRATRASQIRACAEAGEPMPQKSTYFFPKLPSGGVVYRLK